MRRNSGAHNRADQIVKEIETGYARPEGGYSIYDRDNPYSVYNLLENNKEIQGELEKIPPEIQNLTFKELETKVQPDLLDRQLRVAFWKNYLFCCDNKKYISVGGITAGLCSKNTFIYRMRKNPLFLPFILFPIADYKKAMEELLDRSIREMQDILELPLRDRNGKPNVALAKLKLDVFEKLDVRLKGSVIQRVQIHQKTEMVKEELKQTRSVDDIEKEIKLLEKEIKKLPEAKKNPDIIDVEASANVKKTT
jgi:hypothetical protein